MIKAIYWVPVLEAVLLLGLCIYLVRIYGDMKRTGWFTLILVVLGWYMAFSMIFAIPLDIYIVSTHYSFGCYPCEITFNVVLIRIKAAKIKVFVVTSSCVHLMTQVTRKRQQILIFFFLQI